MNKRAPRKQKRRQGRQQTTPRPDRDINGRTNPGINSIGGGLRFEVSITKHGEKNPFWLKCVATHAEAEQLTHMNQQLIKRHKWDHTTAIREIPWKAKPGDFIKEGIDLGLILSSGPKTFDVIWIGGSTTRYQHGVRDIRLAKSDELEAHSCAHLTHEAKAAHHERRAGAGRKRGTVAPRR